MTDRPIVIVGLMGSGKTSVAKRVAPALGRPIRDSDEDLQAWYGQTAATHAERYGARLLHDREARQLCNALAEELDPPPIIAAAASVVEDPACCQALREAFVVWLDAPPAVLAERMRDGTHRPHYESDLEHMLTTQRLRRAPLFAEVADMTVDVSEAGPDEAAEAVILALRELA
jgi:shikimate kinase